MAPYQARSSSPYPWCAFYDDVNQWLAIDLGTSQTINKIEIVTHNSDTKYVTSYKVSYSDDGQSFTRYSNEVLGSCTNHTC